MKTHTHASCADRDSVRNRLALISVVALNI